MLPRLTEWEPRSFALFTQRQPQGWMHMLTSWPGQVIGGLLFVFGGALLIALPPLAGQSGGEETVPAPGLRWVKGMELAYQGTVEEESRSQGSRFLKQYRIECLLFILGVDAQGSAQAVFQTRLTQVGKNGQTEASSIRLELGPLSAQGQLAAAVSGGIDGETEGPETWETGFLFKQPPHPWTKGMTWDFTEPGEPVLHGEILDNETLHGTVHRKLQWTQESPEWTQPRGDRHGWRSVTTVWVHPRTHLTQKVLRVHERRHAAHRDVTYRMTTSYELNRHIVYEGKLFEDRHREIEQTLFAKKQLQEASQAKDAKQAALLDAIVKRIDGFQKQFPATPYRESLLKTRELALTGGRRQWVPPVAAANGSANKKPGLIEGEPAPEFICQDIDEEQTHSLRGMRGQPVLLVFFQPKSATAAEVLPFLEQLYREALPEAVDQAAADQAAAAQGAAKPKRSYHVLGVLHSPRPEDWKPVKDKHGLTFPVVMGTSLRLSYGVTATPAWVLIDREGLVAEQWTGWGPEWPTLIRKSLQR